MHPLVEHIGNLTVMDLVELTKEMEDRFGVKASEAVVLQQVVVVEEDKVVKKTEFSVNILGFTDKVATIKLLKELFGMPLMDAKTLLETTPKVIKEGMTEEACQTLTGRLDAIGVKYEVL